MQRWILAAAVVMLAACDTTTEVRLTQRTEAQLNFLSRKADAPALARTTASFWAVRGEDREVRIDYRARPGQADSAEFLRFRVRDGSLLSLPGGIPLSIGDSVLITVTVVDPARFVVEFQPAGLLFAAAEPAELEMRYVEANADFNADGRVDAADAQVEQQLRIWRQERIGAPWVQMPGRVHTDSDKVEADVTGFTRYAIAY